MNQNERCGWLIRGLLQEQGLESQIDIPLDLLSRKRLLRTLMNVRPPKPADPKWLQIQDGYYQEELRNSAIVDAAGLPEIVPGISLWRGDITQIQADAIVNAANHTLLGCFIPHHGCIDNAVHSCAGVQLRLACHDFMEKQEALEPIGQAVLTPGFNLPAKWVLHTVGPQVHGVLTARHIEQLESCYRSCLQKAQSCQFHTLVFCCIATGEYHFPSLAAAQIAVSTVQKFIAENEMPKKVIFNVFQQRDEQIYQTLLNKQNKF
ncbi:protein-ADP-ribose hydrolase [Holdemania massiliensis]|uniref:Protein-ADP-ribose hydrolase n=1 Tax=Holdemania massiliensis TaxID=1468449 RepID=A0A6N7S997_9FIRM|nr:protein-ADP-ribose hydrolase [Holdemania massiliensis]MSA71924.1 protein-ADP-ribose hydrolase [Holdemania massiliensis]MSA90200.1 protein-ADP-ribose hydrolase [Holdemania massiliensis]MSB79006.1 protein-ADP-ribose hydrolase [Holdemania massiliensis]MSC33930.1 protein-ADP-ribose hydrolase [Holdemania massiliensis]MSC40320.1 protein-ADP-ribose hydrolase [Holdemania massiliensis]